MKNITYFLIAIMLGGIMGGGVAVSNEHLGDNYFSEFEVLTSPIPSKSPTRPSQPTLYSLCREYGVEYDEIFNTIMCESRFKHDNVWGKHGEYGIAQFLPSTFYWLNNKYDLNLSWKNEQDQLYLMVLAFADNLQEHWTCYNYEMD